MKNKTESKRNALRARPLFWAPVPDKNKNTCFEAVGGSTDGESSDLWYRIKPVLRGNRIVWLEASSPELRISEVEELCWLTVRAAKNAIDRWHAKGQWESAPKDTY